LGSDDSKFGYLAVLDHIGPDVALDPHFSKYAVLFVYPLLCGSELVCQSLGALLKVLDVFFSLTVDTVKIEKVSKLQAGNAYQNKQQTDKSDCKHKTRAFDAFHEL